MKTCCFIGHRKVNLTQTLYQRIYNVIYDLIKDKKVDTFLFGSRSEFNDYSYKIVNDISKNFSAIQTIAYDCLHEKSFLKKDFNRIKEIYLNNNIKLDFQTFDKVYLSQKSLNTGKYCYLARNFEMIDDSTYCVFYYDIHYTPPKRKQSKNSVILSQTNSGTQIAYNYAIKQNKIIINVYE